jgi:hypothetical protein
VPEAVMKRMSVRVTRAHAWTGAGPKGAGSATWPSRGTSCRGNHDDEVTWPVSRRTTPPPKALGTDNAGSSDVVEDLRNADQAGSTGSPA